MKMADGQKRVVITNVSPRIEGGRHPIKRIAGEKIAVTADLFADGHDVVGGALLHRKEGKRKWHRVPLTFFDNDRWGAEFEVEELGRHQYTVEGWVDPFRTWRRGLAKKVAADQDVSLDLLVGADLIASALPRVVGRDRKALMIAEAVLRGERGAHVVDQVGAALDQALLDLMDRWIDLGQATTYESILSVVVERERARFSAWYELFPRSTSPEPGRHGTFEDLAARLPYIADLGFDVVYLPPIHPIGRTHRKGRNNNPVCEPGEIGSPWAIGAEEGGHKDVHPDLGTLDDFEAVVRKARELGMEIALDIAFQCSPDHPYAREHVEWFRRRPDGTIQYAENPPKKYEDIYPFDFESVAWKSLWNELHSVIRYWADLGIRAFRVDNPHTKSFCFWEWLIDRIRKVYPDTIFLSEAFTRPKVMYELARIGFTQSYTYFTWRDTAAEFREYLEELCDTEVAEYFRPNFWPNTPDILPEHLQEGDRATFASRLLLAATLSSNYGMYGPVFELLERTPKERGSEEYLDSEKYQLRHWDLDREPNVKDLIRRINRIRRENPALQQTRETVFHSCSNDKLLCYSKRSADGGNVVLVVVNMETRHKHSGWVDLDLEALDISPGEPYEVHDLLDDSRYAWSGPRNFVEIDPEEKPAHLFRVKGRSRR